MYLDQHGLQHGCKGAVKEMAKGEGGFTHSADLFWIAHAGLDFPVME